MTETTGLRPVLSVGKASGGPRLSVLVGGTLTEQTRRDIEANRAPRIDVFLMADGLGANIYDFGRLELAARTERRASFAYRMARRTRQWSLWLAYYALPLVRHDDAVYATGEDVGFALAALLRAYRARRPRVLVRLEEVNYGRTLARRTAFSLFAEYALHRVEKMLCRTTAHLHYLHSVRRQPMKKLAFLPQTCDLDFYNETYVGNPPMADAFSEKPYIVSAGLEMRDYPTLIEAVRDLPVNLLIAASSPWSHNQLGPELSSTLPNVRVSSFSPVQMRELYRAAAFVVVPVRPSLRACGMNVALEAWAMRKGVIATRTAGLLDYIVDGHNGLLVEPYHVLSLRRAIVRLLNDPDEARRLGRNGRTSVERHFSLDEYVACVGRIVTSPPENSQ